MRAAAEIGELAGAVDGNLFVGLGELLDEMALHEVAFFFELGEALVAGHELASVRDVLLHQLLHLLLDFFEVFGGERRGPVEIVEESALGCGTVAELGLGEKFEHGRGQQMRGRMPVNFERLGIAVGEDAQGRCLFPADG